MLIRKYLGAVLAMILTSTGLVSVFGNELNKSNSFNLLLRSEQKVEGEFFRAQYREQQWAASQTAIIVCDMWDLHHCRNATFRVAEVAPRLNRFVQEARRRGAVIIHAPSSCMNFYKDHPARKRAIDAPKADFHPKDIGKWCTDIPSEKDITFPVDHSDGGCDSVGEIQANFKKELQLKGRNPGSPWIRQISTIEIKKDDYISDNGHEIWNILTVHGIKNVMVTGVHTNMCVLGRPFGLRQMSKNGKNTVLVRDLTDTMYNPQKRPFLNHFRGTDRVIQHIERFVCSTITSDQVLGGTSFKFNKDKDHSRIVFVVGEREYKTERTLPIFVAKYLEPLGYKCDFVHASQKDRNAFPGLKLIEEADLLFLSVRRRSLNKDQLQLVKNHLEKGKPLVGIRTASHAFGKDSKDKNQVAWHSFDEDVLGAKYKGHYGKQKKSDPPLQAHRVKGSDQHPILKGVAEKPFKVLTHLYKTQDVQSTVTGLLDGKIGDKLSELMAWTNEAKGRRVFYTTLGGVEDFAIEDFNRMLVNAVKWCLK